MIHPPMRTIGKQIAAAAVEEANKERKRRRRQNRRPRPNLVFSSGGVCKSMDSACRPPVNLTGIIGASTLIVPPKASEVSFSSLPTMHINGHHPVLGVNSLVPGAAGADGEISRSCPLPTSSCPLDLTSKRIMATPCVPKKYFSPHWSDQSVEEAIEKGSAYKATIRVNMHNRAEAYCSIDGLPLDILINGVAAQNRAIEGDIVAVELEPVAYWTKLKGSFAQISPVHTGGSEKFTEKCCNGYAKKLEVDANCEPNNARTHGLDWEYQCHQSSSFSETAGGDLGNGHQSFNTNYNGNHSTAQESSSASLEVTPGQAARALERICAMITSNPSRRPTGRVLSIVRPSTRREAVVGFLSLKQWTPGGISNGGQIGGQVPSKNKEPMHLADMDCIYLTPTDSKFPKMVVAIENLPDYLRQRLNNGDTTVERELVAARIDEWNEESLYPMAHVILIFGQGGEIEPQVGAILFENAISDADFPAESLACLPNIPWRIPNEELESRKDLRRTCTLTIDPSSATDLDDALSVEALSDNILRIGVHIADVSYFVRPGTAIDAEAQVRSTSVYIIQHKLPMLPPELTEEVCSLVPGVDRLAFSIIWDIDQSGNIIDRWIGHSIINSCCKLSYDFVQDIIDGAFEVDQVGQFGSSIPQFHGQFELEDVVKSLQRLHEASKKLREIRFKDGALSLDNAKLVFLFDENGTPYDSFLNERKGSCFLVEEFMLLANRSVAEVISRAFPDCALLRRHPEPNPRKLRDFEAFCIKHGFELETTSSGRLHLSLSKIRERFKNDPVLFDIVVSYASKPMQSAAYFCTGDLRGSENDWGHYALSIPLYTHFTSPLRRYPDIIVHRTLSAVVEAEEVYMKQRQLLDTTDKSQESDCVIANGCFTGLNFNKGAAESKEGREILLSAAQKFQIPGTEVLTEVAAYCNERKLASRHAEEAGVKLYLWALLKKRKVLVSEARVLELGPRFMSVYIQNFALERRIYYDDVEALTVEWLETTRTLLLDIRRNRPFQRKGCLVKFRAIEDVAFLMNASDIAVEENNKLIITTTKANEAAPSTASSIQGTTEKKVIDPFYFPLVLRQLSTIPVVLHPVGGNDGPVDVAARLYMCSYFK